MLPPDIAAALRWGYAQCIMRECQRILKECYLRLFGGDSSSEIELDIGGVSTVLK